MNHSIFQADTLSQWLKHLESLHPVEIELGLDRITSVSESLSIICEGKHQLTCPVVTVAGTNGKGSTIASLEAILTAHGKNVAVYTSPHLITFNERIKISGELATDEELIAAFSAIENVRGETSLSYFEFSTLAALLLFKTEQSKVDGSLDVILLEVGLGGRLDAVNIIDADVAVITSIAKDHTDWLGNSLAEIAYEKAGVFKPSCHVVLAEEGLPSIIESRANELNCSIDRCGIEYSVEGLASEAYGADWLFSSGSELVSQYILPAVPLRHSNVAAAIQVAIHLFKQEGEELNEIKLKHALLSIRLQGRQELLVYNGIQILLDVAHNEAAISELSASLSAMPAPKGRRYALLGMLKDKTLGESLLSLKPFVSGWHVLDLAGITARGFTASELKMKLEEAGIEGAVEQSNIKTALNELTSSLSESDQLVIFGSFYTVAATHDLLRQLV